MNAYKVLLLLLLSHFSRVQLCATPWTAAYQASPSMGFSRQEYWSELPFPSPMHESGKWKWSHSVLSDSVRPHGLQPTRLLHPWDFLGNSTGVGCHCLLPIKSYIIYNVWWVAFMHIYILIKIEERPAKILEYQIVRNLGVLRNHSCYSLNNFSYLLWYGFNLPNWVPQVALVVKNLPTNAGDMKNGGSISGFGRSPGLGNGNSLHYSCLETPWTEESGRLQSTASWSWPQLKWLSMHACCQTMLYISDQIRSDQSLSRVRLFATPWIAARQASLSITNSRSSLRLTPIESVMPSSYLILCRPLLLLPPTPPRDPWGPNCFPKHMKMTFAFPLASRHLHLPIHSSVQFSCSALSRSLPKLMSIESVMPSSHLILCHPLLLLPPIPHSIRVFSNESTLHMR